MYYSFISFLIFSLVFNYYSLLYLTKQTNWYLLHVICNIIVIIATFNDTITCFANPLLVIEQGNTNNNFKSDGLGVAVSLHFFHIIRDYKTLTMIDWTHHLISNFFLGILGLYYFHNSIFNCGLFFMCGLPGGIDYLLLFLYKIGKFKKGDEKKINVFLNNWIRLPGLLYNISLMHISYSTGYINVPSFIYYLSQFFTALNAIYFAQRVTLNFGSYLK